MTSTQTPVGRQPREIRYVILVDGEVASAFGRRLDANRRAVRISMTWKNWSKIELVDSWGGYPRHIINNTQTA